MMRSGALVQGVCEILEFHFGQRVWESFEFALFVFFLLDLVGRMEVVVKFSTTYYSAKILLQSVPPFEDNLRPFVLGYRLDRIFSRYRGVSKKNLRLSLDLLNLKRCCPTVSDTFIKSAMQKHAETICGSPRGRETPVEVVNELRWFMNKMIMTYGMPEPLKLELPSSSSCYGISRAAGGPETLVDRFIIPEEDEKRPFDADGYKEEVRARKKLQKIYRRYGLDTDVPDSISEPLGSGLSYPKGLLHCVRHEVINPLDDWINAEAVPITEPCKVRVITKGEPIPYLASKSFQVSTSKWLGKCPNLKLTRKSFCEADVVEFLEKSVNFYGVRDLLIVSADYSAASDNISSRISVEAAAAFVPIFGSKLVDLIAKTLLHHRVRYDRLLLNRLPQGFVYEQINGKDVTEEDFQNRENPDSICYKKSHIWVTGIQKNGQLMGSFPSFVVLCMANLSIIGSVLRKFSKDDGFLPILVNGDDALFCLPSMADYEDWKARTTHCGLALSAGKNYVVPWNPTSPKSAFLMINSKCYQINGLKVQYIPYINGALLRGWTKTSAEFWTLLTAENGIASRFNQLIEGFCPLDQWKLARKFIRWWSWALFNPQIIPSCVPWYIPEAFGGLGFKPIPGPFNTLCFPGRENRPLDYIQSYGIYTVFRGQKVSALVESKEVVGDRDMYKTHVRIVDKPRFDPDPITLWRGLTKRFKEGSNSSLCRRTAKVQDRVDSECARGGVKIILSREPLSRLDYPLGWTVPEAISPLFCGRVSDSADFPKRMLAQVQEELERNPLEGLDSWAWRNRGFVRGVREWETTLKSHRHKKLPRVNDDPERNVLLSRVLTSQEVLELLWDNQFVTPLVRGNCNTLISCDNPDLILFPGDLQYQGVKLVEREDFAPYWVPPVHG